MTATRLFVVQPETSTPHPALDTSILAPRMRDVYKVWFAMHHEDEVTLQGAVFQICASLNIPHQRHRHNWIAFVAHGPTAQEIDAIMHDNPHLYIEHKQALSYWMYCRLVLEEREECHQQGGLSMRVRNKLYDMLFNEVARMVLAHERTPCDIRLCDAGLSVRHVNEARRIWQAILFAEPASRFPSRTHWKRCNARTVWYPFVRYCGTRNDIRKALSRARVRLNTLRVQFPGGYHEMDPKSAHFYRPPPNNASPPTERDVLLAYERTQAYVYLLACKDALRNAHATVGKKIHAQRRRKKRKRKEEKEEEKTHPTTKRRKKR